MIAANDEPVYAPRLMPTGKRRHRPLRGPGRPALARGRDVY